MLDSRGDHDCCCAPVAGCSEIKGIPGEAGGESCWSPGGIILPARANPPRIAFGWTVLRLREEFADLGVGASSSRFSSPMMLLPARPRPGRLAFAPAAPGTASPPPACTRELFADFGTPVVSGNVDCSPLVLSLTRSPLLEDIMAGEGC